MSNAAPASLLVLPPTTQPACLGRQPPVPPPSAVAASLPSISKAALKKMPSVTSKSNAAGSSPRSSPPPAPRRTQKFPTPLIFPPLGGKHKQTFIVLHNRGTNARRFGPRFVEQPVSPLCASSSASSSSGSEKSVSPVSEPPSPSYNISNLQTLLPYTRFVFPSASMTRSSSHDGASVSQWFEMKASPTAPENERLMVPGLRETVAYLHGLIECEAKLVGGAKNVIIGGLSQGSAASLAAMMLWEGEPLRACVSMAGWLPFCEQLEDAVTAERGGHQKEEIRIRRLSLDEDNGNTVTRETETGDAEGAKTVGKVAMEETACSAEAVRLLCKHLGLPTADDAVAPSSFAKTPVFFGHGINDDTVATELAEQAAGCLSALGFHVQHEEYDGLGHWYCEQMLGDVVSFLGCIDRPIVLQATECPAHDDDNEDNDNDDDDDDGDDEDDDEKIEAPTTTSGERKAS